MASEVGLEPMDTTSEEVLSRALDLAGYGGMREQATRELLLATLLTTQAAQIQDLMERVEQLEVTE